MIRTLRRKVISMTMLLITVLLAAVLIGVFLFSRNAVIQNSQQQLEQALLTSELLPLQPGGETTSFPCFIADVLPDGSVRISGSHYYDLQNSDTLLSIIQDCLAQKTDRGVLRSYHLRYYRQDGLLSVRIAFMDSSFEQSILRSMAMTIVLIGLAALLVLFLCSYWLSGLIIRPVQQSWDAQRRFLSDASHELKTPLTVILSSAELLKESVPDKNSYVDNICTESRRMKRLVEDMLFLSRMENLPDREMTLLDLSELACELAMRFEPVAFEAGHPLQDQIESGITVRGDRERLYQALGALLDNAVKYAAPHTPVRFSLNRAGKNACVLVENEGTPIPPEQQAHLFERFYRVDASRSQKEGFGLGLAIARSAAQLHKGTLRCESDLHSTRFYLTLPL